MFYLSANLLQITGAQRLPSNFLACAPTTTATHHSIPTFPNEKVAREGGKQVRAPRGAQASRALFESKFNLAPCQKRNQACTCCSDIATDMATTALCKRKNEGHVRIELVTSLAT